MKKILIVIVAITMLIGTSGCHLDNKLAELDDTLAFLSRQIQDKQRELQDIERELQDIEGKISQAELERNKFVMDGILMYENDDFALYFSEVNLRYTTLYTAPDLTFYVVNNLDTSLELTFNAIAINGIQVSDYGHDIATANCKSMIKIYLSKEDVPPRPTYLSVTFNVADLENEYYKEAKTITVANFDIKPYIK